MNDSSTGGFLLPAEPPAPIEDLDLEVLFQSVVAGITGLAGNMVRPRWQPNPPKQPTDPATDWCAIGVTESDPDAGPYLRHDGAGDGSTTSFRHETLSLLASFYGAHGKSNAKRLRDGLSIAQNLEPLAAADIKFVSCGTIRAAPDFQNQQNIRRYDMPMTFRALTTRVYAIRNITAATIHLFDDTIVDDTIPVPPDT